MIRISFIILLAFSFCSAGAQVLINEFSASNSLLLEDPDFDDYSDWIELYNAGNEPVNLHGYYLTDNYYSPVKWTISIDTFIQANDHILIWADGNDTLLHTNFRISSLGEEIAVFATGAGLIDSVSFGNQMTDISYGRTSDGSSEWAFFKTPTPGSSNTTTHYEGVVYNLPGFSLQGGMYSSSQSIVLSTNFGGDIRYTTDGSAPDKYSAQYSNPIPVNETTVLRARIFKANQIPGPTISHSYFINENSADEKLPVISIATDPDNFWDDDIGIYVQSYKPGWEIPINIELFENDGSDRAAFNERAGAKINGLYSWLLPQKMLGIYFKNGYGSGNLDYPLLRQRKRSSYKNFALRASGSDWSYTLFRDILGQHSTLYNMDIDVMGYRPAIVYVNGEYLGIHNIREKVDDDYIEKSYSMESGTFDLVENQDHAEAGKLDAYNHLLDLLSQDLSVTANYMKVSELVDIENFTDMLITEVATANTSINHNVMAWKPKNSGKWKWVLMDLDRGFFKPSDHLIKYYTYSDELLFDELITNNSYKQYFAKRLASQLFTSYNPDRMLALIEEHYNDIVNEIPAHIERWQGTTSSYGNALPSITYWENEVCNLKTFVTDRPAEVLNDLQEYNFSGIASLSLKCSPEDGGIIEINHLPLANSYSTGHYTIGMSMDLEAINHPGHQFKGWIRSIENEIVPKESVWKYLDNGTDPGSTWKNTTYNDDSWDSGKAQLGYGEGDVNTTIDYGNSNDRYITTYFRKTFTVGSTQKNAGQFTLKLLKDDGAIVYLNGVEILRSNMDCGTINYRTRAAHTITDRSENLFTSYKVDADLITTGENLLAVEIHQNSTISSDVSFDLEFSAFIPGQSTYYSTEKEISITFADDLFLTADFEQTSSCIIPEVIFEDLTLDASCSPYLANGDILVTENATLTIDTGVEIWMSEESNIFVEGVVNVNGTAGQEVMIKLNPDLAPGSWGVITFKNTSEPSVLSHLIIENASEGPDPVQDKAAISAFKADLVLDNITIEDVEGNPISARYSNIMLTNSSLHSKVTGDLINVKYGYATIENCDFLGNDQPDTDAIDYDEIENGIIRNSRISNFYGLNSDAIDIGEEAVNILIDSIIVHNITDKGISLGQRSTASISNSIFINCNMGIALKDSSHATIDHCLFYSNGQPVASFEKNIGQAGGNGIVTNSILSNSTSDSYYVDSESSLKFYYCLSDNDILPEPGNNLFGDPLFKSPGYYDFELLPQSPAIGTGDNKGSSADIGVTYPSLTFEPSLMIYQFSVNWGNFIQPEFIVIQNPTTRKLDISNYAITKGIEALIPEGTWIHPNSRVFLTDDRGSDLWGAAGYKKFEWDLGQLDNNGESINLVDNHGIVIDYIKYANDGIWPGDGFSKDGVFQLINTGKDNHFGSSWTSKTMEDVLPVENIIIAPGFNIYPNPTSGILYLSGKDLINQFAEIYNISGVLLSRQMLHSNEEATIDLSTFADGILFVKVGGIVKKLILNK